MIKRTLTIWIILMVVVPCAFATTLGKFTLGELKAQLRSVNRLEDRIRINIKISEFYLYNKLRTPANRDSALFFAGTANQLCRGIKDIRLLHESEDAIANIDVRVGRAGVVRNMISQHHGPATHLKLILAGYYLYKSGEAKIDLDSSSLLANEVIKESADVHDLSSLHKAQFYLINIKFERGDKKEAIADFKKQAEIWVNSGFYESAADAYCRAGDLTSLSEAEEKLKNYRLSELYYNKAGQPEEAILLRHAIGNIYYNKGKLDTAETILLSVIDWYKANHYKNMQDTYLLLSAINRYRGNLNKAIQYALLAVKYAELTENDRSNAYFFTNVAELYSDVGNEKESVNWFRKALDLMHQSNSEFLYNILKELSDYLIKRGGSAEVLRLLNSYNARAGSTAVEKEITACIKGNCAFYDKKYREAEKYYLEMMYWESKAKVHTYNSADSYHTIAEFYIHRKAYDKAGFYLNQILMMPVDTYPLSKIKDVYLGLYLADSAKNDLKAALVHYKKYKTLNDSILNQSKDRKIQELLVQYQTEQKVKDNNLLRKESIIQAGLLQKARLTTKITIAGIAALLVILGLLYKQFRDRKIAAETLAVAQQEITGKNNSLQELIGKQEKLLNEKEWLIKEIHHRVKNNLQLIMSLINSQVNYLDNEEAISALKDSQNRMHSISLIHQKLYQSANVSGVDIRSYVIELMKFLCDSFHLTQRINFSYEIPEIEFDVAQAMPLGLIINEAVTNILKYAFPDGEPAVVTIRLKEFSEDLYEFSISDNGRGLPEGFNPEASMSLGMVLMRGLSQQLGGELRISSGRGVTVTVLFRKVLMVDEPVLNDRET